MRETASGGAKEEQAATGAARLAESGPARGTAPGHGAGAGETEAEASGPSSMAPVTVERLIRCQRLCQQLRRDGRQSTSSREIGRLLGCKPSLIRKDFSRLGKLGVKGHGYRIGRLLRLLEDRLGGGDGPVAAVLVGTGALGAALLARSGFARDGFRFLAAFDFDPDRDGARCDGLVVNHVSRMPEVLGGLRVDVGVLAVPEAKAQEAAELLVENGVRAILNVTPAILRPRRGVVVTDIDLATEVAKLAFYAAGAQGSPGKDGAPSGARRGPPAGAHRRVPSDPTNAALWPT